MSCSRNGPGLPEYRPQPLERLGRGRQALARDRVDRAEPLHQGAQIGREQARLLQCRRQLVERRLQLHGERIGVHREVAEVVQRRARRAQERRERLDRLRERLVLGGQRAERRVERGDGGAQRVAVRGQRVEDRAAVADQPGERRALLVEHRQRVVGVRGQLGQGAERVVQVLAAPVGRLAERLLPLLEVLARRLVEDLEDVLDGLHLVDLRVGQPRPVLERGRLRRAARDRDVRLAADRLRPQDRARVRVQRRVLRVDLDRRERLLAVLGHTQVGDPPDRHARLPHRRRIGQLERLRERDLDPVSLRLERRVPAERQPQRQGKSRARDDEQDHDRDPGRAGSRLDHVSAPCTRVGCRGSRSGC